MVFQTMKNASTGISSSPGSTVGRPRNRAMPPARAGAGSRGAVASLGN